MVGATDSGFDDDRNLRRIAAPSMDSSEDDGGCVPGKRGNDDSSFLVEVSCSICLELVVDDGARSRAKLQCGHQFHLDCIGSAFNMKGAMQCPNCRNVEKGQWMYANVSPRQFPEFFMEDWIPEEDLYSLSYPEMQYRVQWCPYGELSQAGSFEELEPATTTHHNEFHGHHGAVNHSYLAYVGPGSAASTGNSDNSNNTDDHPWNSQSNDHFHQFAVAPQYHHHHSPSFSLPGAHVVDGDIDSSAAGGVTHPHPFLFSYRSNPRTSPAINAHQGSSTQMREHLHTQHQVFNHQRQHHANGPNLASPLVSVSRRGLPPLPPPPMPDQNVVFFIYPPPSSTGGHHEPETDRFHAWERDWFPRFPIPSNQRTNSSFWHRHF